MYAYTWDPETGGFLLTSETPLVSKEPRPVYYKELDILGFDRYWDYAKDDSAPYMWAEANAYYYRGRLVAKVKGGCLAQAPQIELCEEPEEQGKPLRFVDIETMLAKNEAVLTALENITVKRLYNTYRSYRKKVDVFYVAFSGGKDSVVVLDFAMRALPHNEFKVLFGDTQMEFPDTYRTVEAIEELCADAKIDFIRATSHYKTAETWRAFGPPATVTRWCCSVHKTAPQIIALREALRKENFTGMAFIGVRAAESLSRSKYSYLSKGEKHKGQYSCNPILEWNSAELYLYIYKHKLILNETYKKGNKRAGCLVCPRAAERNEYMARLCYPQEFETYISYIKEMYRHRLPDEEKLNRFVENGGWKARKNGRDLDIRLHYSEGQEGDKLVLHVEQPRTDWKIWIRTIGVLLNETSPYRLDYKKATYEFEIRPTELGYDVLLPASYGKQAATFTKLFKNVFRKSASCIMCRECEADCPYGNISMSNGQLEISNACLHCSQCHKVEKGCLVYKSLELPKGETQMASSSLNCYSHHAPKREWFDQFVEFQNTFHENHTLGSQMYNFFKRFLRDAGMMDAKGGVTPLVSVVADLGLENPSAWALMLANLAYTPQVSWLIRNMPMNERVEKAYILEKLVQDGAQESWVKDVWASFIRLFDLPFCSVGLGEGIIGKEKGRTTTVAFVRHPWVLPDPKVVLYCLYRYAEACDGRYAFTVSGLMRDEEEQVVSPLSIFGLEGQQLKALLNGLAANHAEFISVTFTHDLDAITLSAEKRAEDVLTLFK